MSFELRHTFLESDQRDRFRALAKRYADMGLNTLRVDTPRWPELEPEPGVYVWDVLDEVIDAVTSAGMKVHLNIVDIPAHVLGYCDENGTWADHPWEGYRTWFPSGSPQILPTCWKSTETGEYDATKAPECSNPPRVNKLSVTRLGTALATRYGNRITYYAPPLNEPDSPSFFPRFILTILKYNGDWKPVTYETYDDVVLPFAQGVFSVLPDAQIEGVEAQTFAYMADMLRYQKDKGTRAIGRVSVHGYAGELGKGSHFPDDAVRRMTMHDGGWLRFLSEVAQWGGPWGIGEVAPEAGDDPYGVLDYVPVMRQLGASWVTLMMGEAFFQPGTFANGTYEPNDLYVQTQRMMNRLTMRHRAVAH